MRRLATGGLIIAALIVAVLMAAPAKRKFTGVITDSMCELGDHSHMRMGPTDADCTRECISEHGALYMLYDGKAGWTLSDQKTPEKFAGQRVVVVGTADAAKKTIQVESIAAAK